MDILKLRNLAKITWILMKDWSMLKSLVKNLFFLKLSTKNNTLTLISLIEHLGDIVAAEPISRYLKNLEPEKKIVWVTGKQYCELITLNPAIYKVIKVTCFTEWIIIKYIYPRLKVYDLHIDGKSCPKYDFTIRNLNKFDININNYYNKGNLLYCFSRTSNLEIDSSSAPLLYFSFNNPKINNDYILLHTSSNEPERMWNPNGWMQLISFINLKYPNYKVREVGISKIINTQSQMYEDYTGKRSLKEITQLIRDCVLFIGIDSGFAHMANALNKNSLILIGHYCSFIDYIPYSGFLQMHQSKMINHFKGNLQEMPFSFIEEKIIESLEIINT